jgi:polar amino acid transport system permease protein
MKAWRWQEFFHYLTSPYLIGGAWTTIWLTFASMAAGLIIGIFLALMRMSDRRIINGAARVYVWFWRGTPLLVNLIVIYTALPKLGLKLSPTQSALAGLSANVGAYSSEIIRGGILAVGEGQFLAARALGMNFWTMMRVVVLPQAARVVIPPLGNRVNTVLKTSALASVISMNELLRRARVLTEERFAVLEIFVVAGLYYLIMTTAWGRVQNRIEAYLGRGYGRT